MPARPHAHTHTDTTLTCTLACTHAHVCVWVCVHTHTHSTPTHTLANKCMSRWPYFRSMYMHLPPRVRPHTRPCARTLLWRSALFRLLTRYTFELEERDCAALASWIRINPPPPPPAFINWCFLSVYLSSYPSISGKKCKHSKPNKNSASSPEK